MLNKILVPIDGSANSFRALDHALGLGKLLDSEIVVSHIAVPYDLAQLRERPKTDKKEAKTVLEGWEARPSEAALSIAKRKEAAANALVVAKQKAEAAGYTKISFKEVIDVNPAEVIAEQAEELGTDLIVMGTRGLGLMRSFLVGSISMKVLSLAQCPVIIVK